MNFAQRMLEECGQASVVSFRTSSPPISYIYPPTFYAVSDKFTIFVPLKTTKK